MLETPYFFKNDNYQLFGILHSPDQHHGEYGYVLCHPFLEEKLWTHRVFVNFARELCARGYPVLRFDYMGHGDSDGCFEDSNIESNLSDIQAAVRYVKDKCSSVKKICLVGLRFGAMLAARVAEVDASINRLILWDPVLDGERYMQEVLRTNLTTQLALHGKVIENREKLIDNMRSGRTINVDGYEMSLPMFEQASTIRIKEMDMRFSGKVLVVQIGKEGQTLKKDILHFAQKYAHGDARQAAEEPFWREIRRYYSSAPNLFRVTCDWLGVIDD